MTDKLTAVAELYDALKGSAASRARRWGDIRHCLSVASTNMTPEDERLMLAIMRFDGELLLDGTSAMPHRMSPESMLKSLAAQALGRATGLAYRREMEELLASASPPLACMVRGVIQRAES